MASIYNEAFNVCVWLGDDTKNNAETARRLIKRILDLDEFERLVESVEFADDWKAFLELMTRPWFNRRWVIQEIALAKRATIYCGKAPASGMERLCKCSRPIWLQASADQRRS